MSPLSKATCVCLALTFVLYVAFKDDRGRDSRGATPEAAALEAQDVTALSTGHVEIKVDKTYTLDTIKHGAATARAGQDAVFVVVSYSIVNNSGAPLDFFDRPELLLINSVPESYAPEKVDYDLYPALGMDLSKFSTPINPREEFPWKGVWRIDRGLWERESWILGAEREPSLAIRVK